MLQFLRPKTFTQSGTKIANVKKDSVLSFRKYRYASSSVSTDEPTFLEMMEVYFRRAVSYIIFIRFAKLKLHMVTEKACGY